jgi:hypothetical protein
VTPLQMLKESLVHLAALATLAGFFFREQLVLRGRAHRRPSSLSGERTTWSGRQALCASFWTRMKA